MALKLVKDSDQVPAQSGDDARVARVLDWLASPAGQASEELVPLRVHLATLSELTIAPGQFQRILDLFQARAQRVTTELKPRLRSSTIPLAPEARKIAQDLIAVHGAIAQAYERVLDEPGLPEGRRRRPAVVAARGLKSRSEQYQIAALAAGSAPTGLWRSAHRLYKAARQDAVQQDASGELPLDAERTYREMLALAALQPPRLNAEEVLHIADYVARFAAAVDISTLAPPEPDYRKFWFDADADMGPVAVARKLPQKTGDVHFVGCARLGVLAAEQLRELQAGTAAEHLHLPPAADEAAYHQLLHRLHDAWVDPPTRHLIRRRNSYTVQACVGFDAVRQLFASAATLAAPANRSEWAVLNESPAGFAIVHLKGEVQGLAAGGVIAVRVGEDKPWDVCVVRWLQSENAAHIEIGLQVLASGAQAVRVAFRNTKDAQSAVEGLLLPAVPAVRANEAVLVPAGTCASRRFLMVTDSARTHVVQGRTVNLGVQTASVELFEFQPDPYPI